MSEFTPSAVDQAHEEAVAWHVRVQSDAATDADWRALADWMEQSEAHRQAFETVELLSSEVSDQAPEIAAGLRRVADAVVTPLPVRRRARPPVRWITGIAAAAACLVAAPAVWRAYEGTPVVYRTGAGETRELTLADGSHIHLDAASELKVRFGWRARRVEMAQAEAAFDVAKDPGRAFEITVGDQAVRVVGTEFNIRHYDGTVVVTVRRGLVQVRNAQASDDDVVRLSPGEELRHVEGTRRSELAQVDPDAAFAWTSGRLICDERPLSEIVAYLNRRYRTPIQVSGAAATRSFSGVLELGDQDLLIRRLAEYMSLSVRRSETGYTLS